MSLLAEVSLKNNADFCGLLFRLPERSNPHSRRSSWGGSQLTGEGGESQQGSGSSILCPWPHVQLSPRHVVARSREQILSPR